MLFSTLGTVGCCYGRTIALSSVVHTGECAIVMYTDCIQVSVLLYIHRIHMDVFWVHSVNGSVLLCT